MQVTRLLPIRDWHSQEARAEPVSVPSQKEAAGEVFSHEATQAGVSDWARARSGKERRRKKDFMILASGRRERF